MRPRRRPRRTRQQHRPRRLRRRLTHRLQRQRRPIRRLHVDVENYSGPHIDVREYTPANGDAVPQEPPRLHIRISLDVPNGLPGATEVRRGVSRRTSPTRIENTPVRQSFDIFVAAGGADIATDQIFNAVTDRQVNVVFTSVTSHAEVNAIE